MYRFLFTIIFALAFSATAEAQAVSAEQVSQDSTINIIAYFCKNDTLEYVYHDYKAKVENNDTTVKHHIVDQFQLIVRDSTANGYEIEVKPLKTEVVFFNDSLMTGIFQALQNKMGDMSTILTTDELGQIQHIKNWKEIKDFTRRVIKAFCDSLYANQPQLNEIIPRTRFESQINMQLANEKAYLENSDDLQLLFLMHGKCVNIGKTDSDDTDENGYQQHTTIVAGYEKTDEETGFEDDFFMEAIVKKTIPKDDVKQYAVNAINMTVADKYAGKVNEEMDKIEYQDATVTSYENYEYFYNGWPCDMEHSTVVDIMGIKNIETHRAVWTSRTWGNYTNPSDNESPNI